MPRCRHTKWKAHALGGEPQIMVWTVSDPTLIPSGVSFSTCATPWRCLPWRIRPNFLPPSLSTVPSHNLKGTQVNCSSSEFLWQPYINLCYRTNILIFFFFRAQLLLSPSAKFFKVSHDIFFHLCITNP